MVLSLSTTLVHPEPQVIFIVLVLLAPGKQTVDGLASHVCLYLREAFLVCSDGLKAFPSA